ncbi:hypothetical protein E5288_WYG014209 [Bos mutus]|uniref:Uncharacterized protein n=1 Tax=Bos mutus TaxID=72004 RepID=A0A6B0R5L8_9CETA|nr:hypothetical protein [Bos mutus]
MPLASPGEGQPAQDCGGHSSPRHNGGLVSDVASWRTEGARRCSTLPIGFLPERPGIDILAADNTAIGIFKSKLDIHWELSENAVIFSDPRRFGDISNT